MLGFVRHETVRRARAVFGSNQDLRIEQMVTR